MAWTDDEKETMRRLTWTDGMSATDVALHCTRIWGRSVTRNMVLGVLHRNGWAGAVKEMPISRAKRKMANAARRLKAPQFGFATPASTPVAKEPDALPEEDVKPANCYPLTHRDRSKERPDHTCQWFYGDPLVDPYGFCPNDKVIGLPYCDVHARKAYQPTEVKQRVPGNSITVPAETDTDVV